VAFFGARTYLETNLTSALLMCCGMLVFGLGSTVAGWLRDIPNGANFTVTIHNTCALVGSVFHLSAAMRKEKSNLHQTSRRRIKALLSLSIFGVCVFTALLVIAVFMQWIPPFISQNGFSMLRQIVLWSSIVCYLSASMLFSKMCQWHKSDYFHWYSFSLALIAVGLFAVCAQPSVGSPVGWIGRFDQYIGCIFALLSMIAAIRTARAEKTALSAVIFDMFADDHAISQRIVETSADAIVSIDQNFYILYLNPAAEKMFGIRYAQSMKTSFLDYLSDSCKAKLQDDFNTFIAEGISVLSGITVEIEAKDSKSRTFPIEMSTIMSCLPTACVGTFIIRDITERKKAEEIVNRQTIILTSINHIYEKAFTCKSVEELGKACLEIVEFSTKSKFSFIGESAKDGFHHYVALSNPGWDACSMADKDKYTKIPGIFKIKGLYGSVYLHGRSILTNDPSNHTDSTGLPQGHPKLTAFLAVPFFHDGKVEGMIAVGNKEGGYTKEDQQILEGLSPAILEVIMRRRSEDAYRESESLLHTIIEGTTDPVFLKDHESKILMANTAVAKITGKTIEEMIGKDDYAHYADPGTARVIMENDKRIMDMKTAEVIEENILSSEGFKTFLSSKVPWCDSEGNIKGIIGIARDITERKKMELELKNTTEELKKADNAKNEFLNALSHELRNPLATIVAGLSLLDLSDDKKQKIQVQEIIQRQINQLCHLVDDLLDLTRITRNKIELKKERIDLKKLALATLEDHRMLFEKKEIALESEITEDILLLDADPVRIQQLIENLLHNAMKFTNAGGTVKLSLLQEKKDVVIHIADNGIGIKPELLPRIFQPFIQADHTLDRRNGGLGLGLSIVKGIAELHGGRVNVYSDGLGKGAQFSIYLPLFTEDSKRDAG
jgi:PAS domain S-box-containing protein